MARIRTIKPSFFRHGGLFDVEQETGLPMRVAYAGLWTACDREGRFRWEPRELKLDCLPHDPIDFSRVLDALLTRGFIRRYAVAGVMYGYIPSWSEHQVINNRETPSSIPEPIDIEEILTRDQRVADACRTPLKHAQGEGKGREGNMEGKGKEEVLVASAPKMENARGTRLPENWTPGIELLDWANAEGFTNAKEETARFCDYWRGKAGKDGRKSDWGATWRNWMRKSGAGSARMQNRSSGPENGFATIYRENYGNE